MGIFGCSQRTDVKFDDRILHFHVFIVTMIIDSPVPSSTLVQSTDKGIKRYKKTAVI